MGSADGKPCCLCIAGVFPPAGGAGALRLVKLLKYMPEHGIDVHVIAPAMGGGFVVDRQLKAQLAQLSVTYKGGLSLQLGARLRGPVRKAARAGTSRGGIRAVRWVKELRDVVLIPDEYALWATTAWREARRILRAGGADLLMTASFPYSSHLAGLLLARELGVPWWVDFADPWAGHRFRGMDRGGRLRLDSWLERAVLRHANAITVASPGMLRRLQGRMPHVAQKAEILTNTFDAEDFAAPIFRERNLPLRLSFFGSFDAHLTPPDPILAALDHLARTRADCVGKLTVEVRGMADLESTRRIEAFLHSSPAAPMWQTRPFLPHREAIVAMQSSDALTVSVAAGADWHLTAKVIEYLATSRPVIAIAPAGDCRNLVERAGGGWVVSPSEPQALAQILLDAIEHGGFIPPSTRNTEVVKPYAASRVAVQAANIVKRLVA